MKQDLKTRIPVAILYVLIIGIMTLSGQMYTVILLMLFFLFCLHEFVSISRNENSVKSALIYSCTLLPFAILIFYQPQSNEILSLCVLTCSLFIFNIGYMILKGKTLPNRSPVILASFIYLVLPFLISIILTFQSQIFPKILLGSFIILWLNDAGAYFIGKAFGKTKLFPSISPKKTWEGFVGGGIAGILISLLISPVVGVLDTQTWIILSLVIWVMGMYGDLIESTWKRFHKIKDSGTLMKGHGGFLDRLDSYIYAIPFVSLYYLLFIA